jgi:hypothetical protein
MKFSLIAAKKIRQKMRDYCEGINIFDELHVGNDTLSIMPNVTCYSINKLTL